VRTARLVVGLVLVLAPAAPAQVAPQQPAERLVVLPLAVKTPADSGLSIAIMDAARDRSGGSLVASIRVRDIGSSGYAALFSVTSGNPGTPAALGEAIAQRLNSVVRAGEQARECNDQRQKSQFNKALDAARKALTIEPNLAAAHICMATVYEAQRMPLDSQLVAYQRAAKGDSLNATAWENVARLYQQKGDTLKAIDAFIHELQGEPQNLQLRLGIAELLRQQKQYQRAVALLDDGLAKSQGDQRMLDLKARICIEGELWRCVLDGFVAVVKNDTTRLGDSAFIKAALGAAQQLADTEQLLYFSHAAVRHFPKSAAFWKTLGAAFDAKGQRDSSIWAYRQSVALDPSDVGASLLVAKAIVDGAMYDTAQAGKLKADTAALHAYRNAFADKLDTARNYVAKAVSSPDTALRLNAAVILLTGGSKIGQAQAYDRARPWLEQTLQLVAPRAPADTVGPRQQIRVQASFWYGVSLFQMLPPAYQAMVKSKNCNDAKDVNDRIARTKEALLAGARVSPSFVNTLLTNLAKFEEQMPKVRQAFKCKNF